MNHLFINLILFIIFFLQINSNCVLRKSTLKVTPKNISKKKIIVKKKINLNKINSNKKKTNPKKNNRITSKLNSDNSIDEELRTKDIDDLTKNIPNELSMKKEEQLQNKQREYIIQLTQIEKSLIDLKKNLKKIKNVKSLPFKEIQDEISDFSKVKTEIQEKIKKVSKEMESLKIK